MTPTFKKLNPNNEKELHSIIEKEIDGIEEGLIVLKHEFSTVKGVLDFLCVDNRSRWVLFKQAEARVIWTDYSSPDRSLEVYRRTKMEVI